MVIEWSLLQRELIRKDEEHGKAIQSDGNQTLSRAEAQRLLCVRKPLSTCFCFGVCGGTDSSPEI